VVVTLPVHPLVGQSVAVHQRVRAQDGRLYVDIRHPDDRCMRLPVEWTDLALGLPTTPSPTRSTIDALLELREVIDALHSHAAPVELDNAVEQRSSSDTKQMSSESRGPSPQYQPADALDDGSSRRSVGGARAPGAEGGERGN